MKRPFILIVGWLGAIGMLYAAVMSISLYWNLFTWRPVLDFKVLACGLVMAGALVMIWFLARSTRDKAIQVVSLIGCLSLLGVAIFWFPLEANNSGFLGRSRPSPLWFRGGRVLLASLPSAFWLWGWFGSRK